MNIIIDAFVETPDIARYFMIVNKGYYERILQYYKNINLVAVRDYIRDKGYYYKWPKTASILVLAAWAGAEPVFEYVDMINYSCNRKRRFIYSADNTAFTLLTKPACLQNLKFTADGTLLPWVYDSDHPRRINYNIYISLLDKKIIGYCWRRLYNYIADTINLDRNTNNALFEYLIEKNIVPVPDYNAMDHVEKRRVTKLWKQAINKIVSLPRWNKNKPILMKLVPYIRPPKD